MSQTCRRIVLGLLLAAPVLLLRAQSTPPADAPVAPPSTVVHHKAHKTQDSPPVVLPPLPSGPLSQMPMEQIPATPAKVSFQGGLLTISAENSSLGEILRDVRKLTGASIEIPPGSAGTNERVVTHIGPGSPRDVLAVLLNGSSFNYVMVGSNANPTSVSSVVLSSKPISAGDSPPVANPYQADSGPMPPGRPQSRAFNQQSLVAQPGPGQPAVGQPASADADDAKDEDADNADENADDQAQPGQPAQPDASAVNTAEPPAQADPNQPNAGPKTPEQILEMLRRQQQAGGPVVTPPPPQQ